jgi:hypothetical protein
MEELIALLVQLFFLFGFGIACAVIASNRGRNPLAWFFIGMLTSCIGLILVLVLENPLEKEERLRQLRQENRRLREVVRGDRMTADRRFQETVRRLEVHDEALGMDTGQLSSEMLDPRLGDSSESAPNKEEWKKQPWYFAEGEVRVGPIPFEDLQKAFHGGRVTSETLIWTPEFEDWQVLSHVPGLEGVLGG